MSTLSDLEIPLPEGADAPPHLPTVLAPLVERIEELLTERAPVIGDFKDSAQDASHGRWLLCDVERDMSRTEIEAELGLDSGEAQDFVDLLGTGTGSMFGSAAAAKVKIPGFRGMFPLPQSPTHPRKEAGSTGGAETVTLSAAQSGVRDHVHPAGTLNANNDHRHLPDATTAAAGGGVSVARGDSVSGGPSTGSINGSTGSPASVGGGGSNAASAHENLPPYRVTGYRFIRV